MNDDRKCHCRAPSLLLVLFGWMQVSCTMLHAFMLLFGKSRSTACQFIGNIFLVSRCMRAYFMRVSFFRRMDENFPNHPDARKLSVARARGGRISIRQGRVASLHAQNVTPRDHYFYDYATKDTAASFAGIEGTYGAGLGRRF